MAAYIAGISNNCCASKMLLPSPSFEPMNISATITTISASETPVRRPMNVCGRDSEQDDQQDLMSPRAHQPGGEQARLACVHHPIGDVEDDRERGAESAT